MRNCTALPMIVGVSLMTAVAVAATVASDCNIGSDLQVIIVITLIHGTPGNKQDQGSFASHCANSW